MEEMDDKELWNIARARVKFKTHLYTYLIVNAFLWGVWFLQGEANGYWPAWCSLGWGIGLAFNYMSAYYRPTQSHINKEFEKLKKKE
ncbi:MAG: 2TM domain-containing protein [Bacteroidetes bacterium]|nr:2TM domain-containing protein [Bacteroidota bacterium]